MLPPLAFLLCEPLPLQPPSVRARFGHWRVFDAIDASTDTTDATDAEKTIKVREQMFQKCLYAPACLGAASDDESLRQRYWAPINQYNAYRPTATTANASVATPNDCVAPEQGGDRNKWDSDTQTCLTDMSYLDLTETCNALLGHDVLCQNEGGHIGHIGHTGNTTHLCRLCDRCATQHQRESGHECSKCPPASANRGFLSLGAVLVVVAVGVLVYLQIKNNGQGELSDGVKKILLNWLQVSSMAAAFPLKWVSACVWWWTWWLSLVCWLWVL